VRSGSGRLERPFTVRLPVDVRMALERLAEEQDRPVAWVVRQALSDRVGVAR